MIRNRTDTLFDCDSLSKIRVEQAWNAIRSITTFLHFRKYLAKIEMLLDVESESGQPASRIIFFIVRARTGNVSECPGDIMQITSASLIALLIDSTFFIEKKSLI